MKVQIFDSTNNKVGEVNLPNQFNEEVRPDLIKRAVLSMQSHKRQPYAPTATAGKRSSAKLSRRRKNYRGSYGFGISRVPRKILTRRGTRMNWVGAFAPGMVGGRRAHPPKTEKIWEHKINDKERRKAVRSAIAATMIKATVEERGHKVPNNYPFIIDDKFETMDKSKNVISALNKLGLEKELDRVSERSIRPGKGKMRGRKYRTKTGPLIVVSKNDKLLSAVSNIPGVDVVEVKSLNAELLAPGTVPGRLTLWTQSAISRLEKESLFM